MFEIPGYDNTPDNAIGPPTYRQGRWPERRTIYSLGCRGWAVWEFTDNLIVNVPGPDIFVFEAGPASEATDVEISEDGRNWIKVGQISGGPSTIDIADFVTDDQSFSFIRLTDAGQSCARRTAGADIDAIAAMGYAWKHIEDDTSTVFFATGKSDLRPEAKEQLDLYFADNAALEGYRLQIMGHTDSVGREDANQSLSEQRAAAVAAYLAEKGYVQSSRVVAIGEGESRPVDDNVTPKGRARNRRVEIVFFPLAPCSSLRLGDPKR